ncbi:DNA polymerase III subunit delta' [Rubrivivax albus]|uniref:DNA polymerase III subunit delta n=1 Tax=Rubrivivax albus TaxID=2499835 RepID=A0A3S2U078_9BURK|nr:DNA polymerase III subunit delta' [Rubrivivax albus]RVT48971.1 DNA polymerase III subunit delta' [Rubrivivax albus]
MPPRPDTLVGPDGALPLPWLAPALGAATGQRGHALLIVAAPGDGALALLRTLAQGWLCEGPVVDGRPCGQCAACRLVQAGAHPDLKQLLPGAQALAHGLASEEEVTNGGKRKPSKWILIDDVRDTLAWVATTRSRERGKVIVLHPAEALQGPSANALLKALEEPPAGVRWLLSCSDPERLLPTVRSRCQRLVMPSPDTPTAEAWLKGQGVAEPAALLAACAGRPLDALALQVDGVDARAWAALPAALARGQVAAWAGWPLTRTLDALQKLCHDLLAQAAGAPPRYFPASALPAARGGVAPLLAWAAELNRVVRQAEHPWNESLLVEALVGRGRDALATLKS